MHLLDELNFNVMLPCPVTVINDVARKLKKTFFFPNLISGFFTLLELSKVLELSKYNQL